MVNKTDYDVKISEIEKKYFTTSDYNKFTVTYLMQRYKKESIVFKLVFYFKHKTTLATKGELKAE